MSGDSRISSDSQRLSLAEHVILGLVAEGPVHGFAVSRLVGPDGALGRVYRIPRPIVYRTLDRLVASKMIGVQGTQPGRGGPRRTTFDITPAGRRALDNWLRAPVAHIRDLRTEFLVKLAVLGRAGRDFRPLVQVQLETIRPILAALEEQHDAAEGFDRVFAAWRYQTAQASLRFLSSLATNGSTGRAK